MCRLAEGESANLSVNVNKVARNSRNLGIPSVTEAASTCIEAGAQEITVHPRPDRRHIRPDDVFALADVLTVEFNIEGNPFPDFIDLVQKIQPSRSALHESTRDLASGLSTLRSADLIYEVALYPDAQYEFKHPLTQEVAYDSQLSETRKRIHAAAARALEELHADKLDERAALLAHHWEEAGDPREAARWHSRAAWWVSRGDPVGAVRHWQSVRDLGTPLAADGEIARLCLPWGPCSRVIAVAYFSEQQTRDVGEEVEARSIPVDEPHVP